MIEIKHKLLIKASIDDVYNAVTTQKGLESWWAKQTLAKPEIGFINVFTFGTTKNEMEVTALDPNQKVVWKVLQSGEEWIGTTLTFELEAQEDKTILRFNHSGWRAVTDHYAECNFAWARFMISLKSYCETGTGTPS